MCQTLARSASRIETVKGFFVHVDQLLFRWFLSEQIREDQRGDLAGMGVLWGKSAILIGDYLQNDETFTVIDLFEMPASDDENVAENDDQYEGLNQAVFESNYLRFHHQLPIVLRGQSQTIVDHATEGAHRWVHIDA